jgi:DeoR family transcriptional regulator, aga operon transcriptional repressor
MIRNGSFVAVTYASRLEVIPAHRRALVLEHVRERGAASIKELAKAIGASISTIRRDLEHLEEKGYLERTHGGALLQRTTHSTFEPEAAISARLARPEKKAIGKAAARSVKAGESVIFDSGSTVLAAAQAVIERDIALTAVTNDLGIGQVLASADKIRVIVPGGSVRPGSFTLVGEPGDNFFASIHVDVAFVGTHAIAAGLLTETSLEVAAVKRVIIAAARRVVLLADPTKFQPAAFCTICGADAIDEIITTRGVDPDEVRVLEELGVAVTFADEAGGAETPRD